MQLLSSLASNLPHLEHLTVEAKRTIPDLGWCGNAYDGYRDGIAKAFSEMVRGAEAAVNASPSEIGDGLSTNRKCRFRIECLPLCRSRWRDGHPFVI
ncbi:hypothetical protein FA13DRAFT_1732361 [Coprinellus micaceus]|jgi:hypothetical protein|uniref:Uncharacterized protein n=1 Tax=Coprinellus micaceus TaxID=71717 RepID=A0A4Y7TBL1_COPMI|nr:hypothetical protein FA13DRAFT_1732361 [Coprinellus micaceus]